MPVDPQVRALLDQLDASGEPPLHERTVDEARFIAHVLTALDAPGEEVVQVTDTAVPGPAGPVPVRIYQPDLATPAPTVAWFHAGGGVIGDLETADSCCRRLANRTAAVVVSVDYRRGPEHRFPAAVDDCWAVTAWLAEQGNPLAVGGDSMGATFAAVVARRAAAAGVALRHQLLVYPMCDATLSYPSVDEFADGYLLTRALAEWFYGHYLGDDTDRRHPDASPVFATDLAGCAPATVVVAECDPARDDALAYAGNLRLAGVPVEVQRYDGMIHVFFALGGALDRADEAMDRCAARLRDALG